MSESSKNRYLVETHNNTWSGKFEGNEHLYSSHVDSDGVCTFIIEERNDKQYNYAKNQTLTLVSGYRAKISCDEGSFWVPVVGFINWENCYGEQSLEPVFPLHIDGIRSLVFPLHWDFVLNDFKFDGLLIDAEEPELMSERDFYGWE